MLKMPNLMIMISDRFYLYREAVTKQSPGLSVAYPENKAPNHLQMIGHDEIIP